MKGVVAINNTTPEEEGRKQCLQVWIKQTQEMLAHRSLTGLPFHRLYNLFKTKRLIEVALDQVLSNEGAKTAGVDGLTKASLKGKQDKQQLIESIWQDMKHKQYRPAPVRRVYIPKPNGDQRPLGIPTIKDRVVQEMLRLVFEPIYETKFYPHSYGFRPYRSTHHAALRLKDLIGKRGYTLAIEGDIRKCFDRIHHEKLLTIIRRTIKDESVVRLVKLMLKAGVMEDGAWHITDEGTPQGGIVSPLLANIYLNELDWFIHNRWGAIPYNKRRPLQKRGDATPCYIVRYADDFVILLNGTAEQAETLKTEVAEFLQQELHLELSTEKTLVTAVTDGFDFLGFNIRKWPRKTLIAPSRKAVARFKQRVKEITWKYFGHDDTAGVIHLNRYVVGWGMYYRSVSSGHVFHLLDHYIWWRVFRTTLRLRQRSRQHVTLRQHYLKHYIPYRRDINKKNRWHRGSNYGVWADLERKTAYIVTCLRFIPIRYIWLHPQHNPYTPDGRKALEENKMLMHHIASYEQSDSTINWTYGPEWEVIRQAVLEKSDYRCNQCGKHLTGREAQVHHLKKIRLLPSRQQANKMENLISLCPKCHAQVERADN
jgi:group II intron reverse transcriptase/maturase